MGIVGKLEAKGLKIFETYSSSVNPEHIDINSDHYWKFIKRFHKSRGYIDRLILLTLAFSYSLQYDTSQILLVTCNRLTDLKHEN